MRQRQPIFFRELRFFFPRTSAETARVQERTLGRERQDGSPDGILGVGWSTGDADLDRRVASMLKALEGTPFAFSKETFAQLVLQLRLNLLATPQLPDVLCFPRFFESKNSISLVPGLCLFNHSCLPNLSVHSLGDIHLIFARGHVGRASRRSESQGASRDSAAALSAEEPAAEALASAGDETELSFAYGGEAAAGECGVHRPRTRQRRWGGGADESGADESGADESDEDESDEDEDCASRGDRESGKARQVKSLRGVARDFVCACARCRREAEEEAAQRRREERREKTPSKKKASRESESEDDMEDEAVSVMEDIRDELRAMRPVERIEFIEAVFTHAALPDSPPLLLEEEQDLLSTLSISHLQKFDFAASLVACARAMLSCCVLERISKASQRDRETDRLEAFGCARLSPAQRRLLLAPVPGPHARFSSCAETPAAGDAGDADEAWTWRYGDVRTWNLSGLVCFAVQAAVSLLLLVDAAETQTPKCGAPAAGASAKRGAATEREADAKGGGFPCQRVEHGRQDGGSSKCGVDDIDAEGRQTARDVEANARCASEREIAKDLIRHASRLHRTLQGGDFRLFLARFEGDFSLAFLNSQGAFGLSSLHAAALKRADVWRVAEEVCVADARQAMRGEKQKKNWSQEGARRVDEAGDDKQGEETEQRKRGGKMEAACEARDEAERGAGHGGDEALISAVELLQLARALAKRKTREEENTTRGDSVEYEGRKKKKVRKEKRGTDRSATLKKKDKMRARQPADADGEMRRPKKYLNKRKKIKMSLKISNQGESGGDCKTNLKREKKGEGKRAKLRRRAT
ncbi:hypothetical protein BESB_017180 [Besnoitia besnoiti]|uniref:SET domain-containing protein n=1 Tax=Besnoitia besnoiti TaxID=94643 RepID=A0A2A9MAK8_BESBE|nr:hypothetical protein BESB_017180 [Besnoitia besnoiti]PFH32400.1 hypothetical protein BESB_017180 [Besnoitia besnoiti]